MKYSAIRVIWLPPPGAAARALGGKKNFEAATTRQAFRCCRESRPTHSRQNAYPLYQEIRRGSPSRLEGKNRLINKNTKARNQARRHTSLGQGGGTRWGFAKNWSTRRKKAPAATKGTSREDEEERAVTYHNFIEGRPATSWRRKEQDKTPHRPQPR